MSDGLAGVFSDDRLVELGLDAVSVGAMYEDGGSFGLGDAYGITGAEAAGVVDRAVGCVDWRGVVAEGLVSEGALAESAGCVVSGFSDSGVRAVAAQALLAGSEAGRGLAEGEMLEALWGCVDVRGVFVDALVEGGGLSEASARCVADVFPAEAFDLGFGAGSDEGAPSPLLLVDSVDLRAGCVTSEELELMGLGDPPQDVAGSLESEEVVVAPSPEDREVQQTATLSSSGGIVSGGGVTVSAAAGALRGLAEVEIREPLGEFGAELGGVVVGVEHQQALESPLVVTWDVSHLTDFQQSTLLLVRWDEDSSDWVPSHEAYEIRDGILTAEIQEWSDDTWIVRRFETAKANVERAAKWSYDVGNAVVQKAQEEIGQFVGKTVSETSETLREFNVWGKKTVRRLRIIGEEVIETTARGHSSGAQTLQELIGRRVDAPSCDEGPLPDWVVEAIEPVVGRFESSTSASVRLCYMRGDGDTVTMRVANNRTYSQFIYMSGIEAEVMSSLRGPQISAAWATHWIAHKVYSNYEKIFVPKLREVEVVIPRPWTPGTHTIGFKTADLGASSTPQLIELAEPLIGPLIELDPELRDDSVRVLVVDVIAFILEKLNIKRIDNPQLQLFLELLLECGVEQLRSIFLHNSTRELLQAIGNGIKSCSNEVLQPDSQVGKKIRNYVFGNPAKADEELKKLLKNRNVWRIAKAVKWLAIAEAIAYSLDRVYDIFSGPLNWSIRGTGPSNPLGAEDDNQSEQTNTTPPPPPPGGTAISAGVWHSCGLRSDATITCWGYNSEGQSEAPGGVYSAVSAGGYHSCGLRTDGTVTCWGHNDDGQTEAPGGVYSAVSAGGWHSCGLRSDGTITCWGNNNLGQTEAPGGVYSAISAGGAHSCALRSDGTVTCWGRNHEGQTEAPGGVYSAVTAGGLHSCGLRTDGTVTCWGNNDYGQTEAPGGVYSAISAGSAHSCGLRSDGTITCWGYNHDGQSEAPGGVYSAVSAGASHSCGLRSDGTVTCWGSNDWGQSEAPGGVYSAISGRSVVLSRGRDAQGVDERCSSANCYFLRVELVGFDLSAGPYAVRCWHYAVPSAGWEHAEWVNYSTDQAVSEYCIWGVADHDVYVIVEDPRTGETVRSDDVGWP